MKYRLMEWGILPISFFFGSYVLKRGFLDGLAGFYFAMYKFQYFFQIQTKIKEFKIREKKVYNRWSWIYKFTPYSSPVEGGD